MQACPVSSNCSGLPSGKLTVKALREHLELKHAGSPFFAASNTTRPWHCALCRSARRCYKTSNGLAKHLLQSHAVGNPQPVATDATSATTAAAQTSQTQKPGLQEFNNAVIDDVNYNVLDVPCLPWFPRPKWWSRPPAATLLLATWNLEHFSLNTADTGTAARKVANMCETLRQLVAREGRTASVVVAIQEVFCPRAMVFLTDYLTEKDAPGQGGAGRVWRCHTSEPLGNNNERAAFLWSGPPVPEPKTRAGRRGSRGATSGAGARVGAGAGTAQQTASSGAGGSAASPAAGPPPKTALLWCGCGRQLERVDDVASSPAPAAAGAATADQISAAAAGSGPGSVVGGALAVRGGAQAPLYAAAPGSFQLLSEADRSAVLRARQQEVQPGRFLRSPLYGLFRVGFCNLVVVNVHLAAEAEAARSELSSLQLLSAAALHPNDRLFHRRFSRCWGLGDHLFGSPRPRGLMAIVGDFNCPVGRAVPAVPATGGPTGASGAGPGPGPAAGPARGGKGARDTANAASWEAFFAHGWFNALVGRGGGSNLSQHNGNGNGPSESNRRNRNGSSHGNGSHVPTATNWRAKDAKALDAICLPWPYGERLVTGRGVCPPPDYVDAAAGAAGEYPNHLLCWVRLDLGPLQGGPGKVRQLRPPECGA